jgi:hypothetical protein
VGKDKAQGIDHEDNEKTPQKQQQCRVAKTQIVAA